MALPLALSAGATNILSSRPPANPVDYNQCALTTKHHDAFHSNDGHDIEPTDVNTTLWHNGCDDYYDDQRTNVRVNDHNYGDNGAAGWWECHFHLGSTCIGAHVHINLFYDANPPYTTSEALSLMCEEIGHSLALDHTASTASSCMSGQWDELHLNLHDWVHLNNSY